MSKHEDYCLMVSGQLTPGKIAPRIGLGFGLGLVLGLGGQFSSGARKALMTVVNAFISKFPNSL